MADKLERRECGVKHAGPCIGSWAEHDWSYLTDLERAESDTSSNARPDDATTDPVWPETTA